MARLTGLQQELLRELFERGPFDIGCGRTAQSLVSRGLAEMVWYWPDDAYQRGFIGARERDEYKVKDMVLCPMSLYEITDAGKKLLKVSSGPH